jgi:hypothetical protein
MNTTTKSAGERVGHTPAPWVASFNGSDDCRIFAESVADSPRAVCKVNMPLFRHLEATANANLIASSPALLDIAQRWLKWTQGGVQPIAVRIALEADTRAAIAKATGQPS